MSAPSYKRAKTRRGRKVMEERAPKLHENPKSTLYIHGSKCPQVLQDLFRDLNQLTKPHSRIFSRKRELRPFEDEAPLEALSSKLDTSLFMVGTKNKKRPAALTIARMFNHRLLDMAQLNVTDFKPMHKFKMANKPMASTKPVLMFNGHEWNQPGDMMQLRSLFIDLFRGPVVERINLAGVDRVLSFTAEDGRVVMTQYRMVLKKSGVRLPLVELEECGPFVDMKLQRSRWAADDLMKEALKQPRQLRTKATKNVEYNSLGDKLGRVHMQRQDLGQLQTRKMKGLKRSAKDREAAGSERKNGSAETGNALSDFAL